MQTHGLVHILLVEDNPQDVHLIYESVARAPSARFTWENVTRLEEAKELLRREPFDVVLLDLSLPDSQGLDTFIQLYPHAICLPVVVLSNIEDAALALQLVRSGAQDCLVKAQLQGETVVQAVRHAIERKQVETALRVRNQQLSQLAGQLRSKTKYSSTDNFAAVLIHELNNPLARVSVQLEELVGQFASDDPRRAMLESIHAEVEQMGHLVGNLLQAAMLNAGQENIRIAENLQSILSSPQSEESKFLEALGVWVLDYISNSTTTTSRLINQYLQQLKSDRAVSRERLSQRELQVVYLVAKGHTNKEIAKQLSLSVRTVERYSSSVMNKLGLQNRAELIMYAVHQGIVNGDDVSGHSAKHS